MSIETSPASTANKAATASATSTAAGKSQGSAKAGNANALGFGAILAAEEVPAADALVAADAKNFQQNDPEAPVDVAQTAMNLIVNLPQVAVPLVPPTTPDTLMSSATEVTSLANSALSSLTELDSAPTVSLDLATEPLALQSPAVTPQAPAPAGKGLGVDAQKTEQIASQVAGVADLAPVASDVTFKPSKVAKSGVSGMDAKQVSGVAEAGKALDTKFFAAMEALKSMQFAKEPQPVAQGPAAIATGLTELSRPEKGVASADAMPTTYSANAPTLGSTSYASTAVVDTAAVGPEMQVAEQVSYWISQDIQNAELTLDGLGKDPVEVSIRMHGNEAQVSFRTDELQTRDLLQGAASHLKELLQSEGLVLSGVSVGTSGSGDAGTGQQNPQQFGRKFASVQAAQEPVALRRLPTGSQGHSLDLFV